MKQAKAVFLDIGALGIVSCFRLAKKKVCVYGSGHLAGCKDTCAYSSVPDFRDLVLGGEYTVEGNVVDVETGQPIKAMLVSLILPTRKRYRTRSDAAGRFKILVKPDLRIKDRKPFRVTLDFARMESVPEGGEIVLFGDFTSTFRRTHPKLRYLSLDVSEFDGETIYMERGSQQRERQGAGPGLGVDI